MNHYLMLIIGMAVMINVISLLFYSLNTSQYEAHMKQVLNLNQFYVNLSTGNIALCNYVQNGADSNYQQFFESMETAEGLLASLEYERISQSFLRDIQDMRAMLSTYRKNGVQIRNYILEWGTKSNSSNALKGVLDLYDNASEIYSEMDGEFKNLHLELLEYTNTEMRTLEHRKKLYIAELFIVILVTLDWALYQGRRMADRTAVPIQELTEAAVKIRDGKLAEFDEVKAHASYTRELQILITVFNLMIDQIQEQFRISQEVADAKLRLHEQELENLKITNQLHASELKVLQMQINPHFLFNTLNMISKTAYLGNSEETVFLLNQTAQLLRYSLDYMGKSVTLERELEILDCYVCIQEKRFGDRIDFDFDLDERFHQIQIPCLILQPLVENCISHGVGMYTSGARILIRTRYLEDRHQGMISVIDNGLGVPENDLRSIRQKLEGDWDSSQGIGLGNVAMRLKSFFHNQASVELYSIPNQETEVRILLPYFAEPSAPETALTGSENSV